MPTNHSVRSVTAGIMMAMCLACAHRKLTAKVLTACALTCALTTLTAFTCTLIGLDEKTFEHYGTTWNEFTRTSNPPYKWLHIFQLRDFMLALGNPLGLPPPCELPDDGTVKTGLGSADSRKFKQVYSQVLLETHFSYLTSMLVNASYCCVVNRHSHHSHIPMASYYGVDNRHSHSTCQWSP